MLPGVADEGAERAVDIYTDGACSGNPGPGGWGAVLRYGEREKELCGGESTETTNNRMELMAAIRALESLTRPMPVRLHTDSTYVRDGIMKWVPKWKRNGWQTVGRQPVKNADLWQRLDAAVGRHRVQWYWVKGHAGHPENERADRLAATGLQEALDAAGIPRLVTAPTPRAGAKRAVRSATDEDPAGARQRCRATTRTRKPCPITARPSGLCHVHDPATQCGVVTKSGHGCTVATGGGPCGVHQAATGTASALL